ncbi:hypothetical protein Pfo_014521 [Paulownia fortunei]|nr:hypothetical protein Pfo_014521 [Paulownia fortunei]
MAKFNVVQKRRRAAIADRKSCCRNPNLSISGKRKRKLLKKWRWEQKEAVEKGLNYDARCRDGFC